MSVHADGLFGLVEETLGVNRLFEKSNAPAFTASDRRGFSLPVLRIHSSICCLGPVEAIIGHHVGGVRRSLF
jgi:hypothetical protein